MDKPTLFIFVVLLVVTQALPEESSVEEDWNLFKSKYSKAYKDDAEETHRMNIFVNNLAVISEHNQQYERGELSYIMAINEFSDLTVQEFCQLTGGLGNNNHPESLRLNGDDQVRRFVGQPNAIIPNATDWRPVGAVTAVKDQLGCSSCWAFAATGALEGQYFFKTGRLVSFSEQNLIDCSSSHGNTGCVGGWAHDAFQYIQDNGGIESDETYPYDGVDNTCKYNPTNSITTVNGFEMISDGDELKLAEAIATVGPIAVAIDSNHTSFQHYAGGIYYEPECSSELFTHMVLAVGYGTDENGLDYYIMKNSWNDGWGLNGYIKMIRNNNNNCGVASRASFPIV